MEKTIEQFGLVSTPLGTADGYETGFRGLVSDHVEKHTSKLDHHATALGMSDSISGTDYDQESSGETDSVQGTDYDDQEPSISDCESGISGDNFEQIQSIRDGLIKVDEDNRLHRTIEHRLLSGLGSLGEQTKVVSICRNSCSSFTGQARIQSFRIFARAMEKKCGGNANVKYAWYGASKDEIRNIVSHGFSVGGKAENNGLYGRGIYLSPDDSPIESVRSSPIDEDGLRHLLLCRVILGKSEIVIPGSDQFHPRSEEFDSGIDCPLAPKKYIVWSTHMNTHIFPECIISFRAPPCLKGWQRTQNPSGKPNSPWMPISALISTLSKFLPPHTVGLLSKYQSDHREKKISRQQMIRLLRQIAGDELLIAAIKSFRDKQEKESQVFPKQPFKRMQAIG